MGRPMLDDYLQTSVAGLFTTSMLATRDFGPFFAFTVAVRSSAKLIGQALVGADYDRATGFTATTTGRRQ